MLGKFLQKTCWSELCHCLAWLRSGLADSVISFWELPGTVHSKLRDQVPRIRGWSRATLNSPTLPYFISNLNALLKTAVSTKMN